MNARDLYFVIPTCRLREVGETVELYDEHFWRNGHSPRIIVFDDSSPSAQEKYYPLLEQTRTHADIYYVGPKEKEQFTTYLSKRLRDKRLDGLVKNLFRPSYGGNRNFTLYRLWVRQEGIAAAHVDAAQNHTKSNYMRNPVAAEVFNEEVCNLLKRKIKDTLTHTDELTIGFDYAGEVTADDARQSLDKVAAMYGRTLEAAEKAATTERADALRLFAANLQKAFYAFEPDFFQQNLLRIVDDVVTVIKGSIELWPTLVEVCYFEKDRRGLPMAKVHNKRRS